MRILALWMVSFFVAVLLAVESLVVIQCSTTPITGLGFTETGNSVVVRIDGQVEQWGGIFDRATYLYTNGHTASIDGLAYSPDGKILASASEDQTVRLWDGSDGHYLKTFSADAPQIAVAFTSDGTHLISVDNNGKWIMWDVDSGQMVTSLVQPYYGNIGGAAFSPDGHQLALGTDNGIVIVLEVATGNLIAKLITPQRIESVSGGSLIYPPHIQQIAFSPDGKTALVANTNADKVAYLFDTQSWTLRDTLPAERPGCAAYSPDGRFAIICDSGKPILWNLAQHTSASLEPIEADNVIFARNDKTFWVIDWGFSLSEYDVRTGTRLKEIPLYFQRRRTKWYPWQRPLAISPNGNYVATSANDNRIRVLNTQTGQLQQVLFGHSASVRGSQVVGNDLLTYSDDKTAILWDVPTGKLVNMFEGQWGAVTAAVLSPDKRYLLAASGAEYGDEINTVKLWDVQSRQILQTLHHSAMVSAMNFSADGQHALTGTFKGEVNVWSLPAGEQVQSVTVNTEPVISVNQLGSDLLIGTVRQIIKLDYGDVTAIRRQRRFLNQLLTSLVVAPDFQWFATIESGQIRMWDWQTVLPIRTLTTTMASALALSPDGNTLLMQSMSNKPYLIDVRTGTTLRTLCPHPLTRRWLVVSGVLFGLLGLRVLQAIFWVVRQLPFATTRTTT